MAKLIYPSQVHLTWWIHLDWLFHKGAVFDSGGFEFVTAASVYWVKRLFLVLLGVDLLGSIILFFSTCYFTVVVT